MKSSVSTDDGEHAGEGRPTVSHPATPKGRRTRERILSAARTVFARDGYVNLRMADVAVVAELSLGGVYRYFGSKEELFQALVGEVHDELFAASTAPQSDFVTDPFGALLEANRGFLAHYHEYRDILRCFVEAAAVDEQIRAVWWRMRERHVGRFVHAFTRQEPPGRRALDDLPAVVESVACMVEQCAYVWYAQAGESPLVDVDHAAHVVTDIWYRAVFADVPGS